MAPSIQSVLANPNPSTKLVNSNTKLTQATFNSYTKLTTTPLATCIFVLGVMVSFVLGLGLAYLDWILGKNFNLQYIGYWFNLRTNFTYMHNINYTLMYTCQHFKQVSDSESSATSWDFYRLPNEFQRWLKISTDVTDYKVVECGCVKRIHGMTSKTGSVGRDYKLVVFCCA